MIKILFSALFALIAIPAFARCELTLMHGLARVSPVPTSHGDEILTTDYTRVSTAVTSKSQTNEIGVECALGYGFSASASYMTGLEVIADRNVSFTGFDSEKYGSFHPNWSVNVRERVYDTGITRLSLLKYVDFGAGNISPYVRLGVEQVKGTHEVSIPISPGYTLTYAEQEEKTAPYAGIGAVYPLSANISLRGEYQILCIHPRVGIVMVGINIAF